MAQADLTVRFSTTPGHVHATFWGHTYSTPGTGSAAMLGRLHMTPEEWDVLRPGLEHCGATITEVEKGRRS